MGLLPNSTLPDWVAALSAYSPLRAAFHRLYRAQLWGITQGLGRQKGVVGVILRRQEVLKDAYPGVSDYDITCVFDSANENREALLAAFHRRHCVLKRFLPVLGETKFVDRKDFPLHLEAAAPAYGGGSKLHYLRGGHTLSQSLPRASAVAIRRRVSAYYKECLSPLLLKSTRSRRTNFGMLKEAERIQWLLRGLSESALPPLRYLHRSGGKDECPDSTLVTLRRNLRLAVQAWDPTPEEPFQIRIEGESEPIPDAIRNAALRIQRCVPGRVVIASHRPYKFNWSVIIRVESDTWKTGRFLPALSEIESFSRILSPAHPLILGPTGWTVAMEWDPFANLLLGHHRFDANEGDIRGSISNDRLVDKKAFRHELAETLARLPSLLRRQDTNYLLDVLFGHLTALRVLLETGVFHASFESLRDGPLKGVLWTRAQESVLDLYRKGEQVKLDRFPTIEVWILFRNLIEEEICRSRNLLSRPVSPFRFSGPEHGFSPDLPPPAQLDPRVL